MEVVPIYEEQAEEAIEHKNRSGYEKAVRALESACRLYDRVGRSKDFDTFLTGLREKHRLKRSLIALLNQAFSS
jgi:uncharacterized Zn finger protein